MTAGRPKLGPYGALRWDLASLLALTRTNPAEFAHCYRLPRYTVYRASRNGLNDREADHWATAAGYHPAEVWGPEWFVAAALTGDSAEVSAGRPPASTGPRTASGRSTGHSAARTPVRRAAETVAVAS